MKKLFLLLVAGSMAMSASAQERKLSGPFVSPMSQKHQAVTPTATSVNGARVSGHKTSSLHTDQGRWYNYVNYMDTLVNSGTSGLTGPVTSAPYLWNDTSSVDAYSDGSGGTEFINNTMVSYGYVFDPYFSGFNSFYPAPSLTTSMGYTVDSIGIYGIYGTNPAKTSVVDTIKIGYVYGTGKAFSATAPANDVFNDGFFTDAGLATDYNLPAGDDTLRFEDVLYDSATNTGAGTTYVEQILTISTGASTNSNMSWSDSIAGTGGVYYKAIALNTPAVIPAGDIMGFTVSFKSGDASFTPNSTVFDGTGAYDYNMFRPLIGYYGSSTAATFFTYNPNDRNTGLFKTLPNFENGWTNQYIPMYAWTAGGAASTLQYPDMDIHVQCPTCPTAVHNTVANVNKIQAVPNPASDVVTIAFSLVATSNVSVTLTDMMGQVVATQNMGSTNNGKAQFNSSALPAGVYFYTVNANGERTTGRVVVAH